ncbi:hypothetical protein OG782_33835 [Streptomyces sp. NBC_00876]|uniref:Rv1733c family protein n=1 Tax=Streptomyces sp. NBC_00876 TaxID=2975853 RepID=UPI00386CFDB4|nr:hypothetical protein OG782_33835 [Streptomyces sp. NBC_00876]
MDNSDGSPAPADGLFAVSKPVRRRAVIFAAVIALICGAIGGGVLWNTAARTDGATAAHRHRIIATTTDRAGIIAAARYGATPVSTAPASWQYPAHVPRSGSIRVQAGTPKGDEVAIWVNGAGTYQAQSPPSVSQRVFTSMAVGAGAAGVVGLAEVTVVLLARRRAMGRRLVAWEREWEEVEPVWTGRLRREPGHDDD